MIMAFEIERGTIVSGGATLTIHDLVFSTSATGIISSAFTTGGSRLITYQGYDSTGLSAGSGNDSAANTLLNLFVINYCSRQNQSTTSLALGLTAQPIKDQIGECLSGTLFNTSNQRWYFISAVVTVVTPRTFEICVFVPLQ